MVSTILSGFLYSVLNKTGRFKRKKADKGKIRKKNNWKWNARVLSPECPCSWTRAAQISRSGRPKRGNLESCGGKNVRARFGTFPFEMARTVFFSVGLVPQRSVGGLKRTHTLVDKSRLMLVLWTVTSSSTKGPR